MVQFKILSGKKAGVSEVVSRFPLQIGRSASADLALDENGVWDRHLCVQFDSKIGFIAVPETDAIVAINGQRIQEAVLRSGDIIDVGGARLQFWLADPRQAGLSVR